MHKATFLARLAFSLILLLTAFAIPQASFAAQTGAVQGVVRGENGQPIVGARVSLEGPGAGQVARTDSNGTYSILGIQPGNYTVRVSVVTYDLANTPITIVQDSTQNLDFSLVKKVLTGQRQVARSSATRRNDTTTSTPVTARDEQREKSQPNNLYQSTGLFNFKPGVTTDAGQYPHIRGSDGNQIQWMIDGINLRDPISNQFATNLVTVGVRSSNIVTGGPTADYGGATGGFLNQLTINGKDIANGKQFGGYIENTNGPASKWQYEGGTTQIGGLLFNNKVDYALSSIVFRTKYGDNTQLGKLNSSHDESGKFNYYIDPSNTATLYFAHGAENYESYQTTPNNVFFSPDNIQTAQITDANGNITTRQYYDTQHNADGDSTHSDFTDHNVQTYNLDHFTYKHNFSPTSFLQYRIYQLHQAIPNHIEGTAGIYNFDRTNVTGNQLYFTKQFSRQNTLTTNLEYTDSKGSFRRQVRNIFGPIATNPTSDRVYPSYPKDFGLGISDQLRTKDNKVTLDLGARFNSTSFKNTRPKYTPTAADLAVAGPTAPDGYTTKSVDPRLGLNYSPSPDLTFRTSYSVTSQRPDMTRVDRVGPVDYGQIGTTISTNPLAQSRSAYLNQGFSRLALSHSKDYDLGVEKAFNVGGLATGQYVVSLTGYKKREYDLTYFNSKDYTALPAPSKYDNEGTAHASGLEFQFRKALRRPSDWNGYVSYTNQVVRSNTSLYDTGYIPYFTSILLGNPNFADSSTTPYGTPLPDGTPFSPARDLRVLNHREFATSWDQRHTLGVVVGKRFTKLLESTFVLDAGSGLPFFSAGASDGAYGPAGSGLAELSGILGGTADFTQVPISLGGGLLPPVNPVVGYTGWHYKFSVNSDLHLTDTFSLFLNVDNLFDTKTALSLATSSFSGEPYYNAPSAQYPQGQNVYKYQSKLTPVFLTFGFRQRF